MKIKIISAFLVLILLLSPILTACTGEDSVETNPEGASETAADTDLPDETTEAVTHTPTETEIPEETEIPTEGNTTVQTETPTETETEAPTEPDTEADLLYENGEEIDEAGIEWDKDAFALLDYTVNESLAVEISAEELCSILNAESATEGAVYIVNEPLVLTSGLDYDGNFASVIATKGIIIDGQNDIVIRELIIKGDVTVKNSSELVFFNVDIQGGDTAVTIDSETAGVAFKGCKISANDLCARIAGNTVTFFETKLTANNGIISTGDETAVHGCHFVNITSSFTCEGKSCIIRNCTLELASNSVAIEYKSGAVNGLVALNLIKNAQTSLILDGGYNCAVIMNSAINITCTNSTNVYTVGNNLGGILTLGNNNYVICEDNSFIKDALDHAIVSEGNTNVNGNDLTDVNARAEVGANEEILPHTNKELFVGMERRTKVLDASFTKQYSLNQYIRNNAKSSDVVIVPPGAYAASSAISLGSTHSGTTVYAYGVYEEFSRPDILLSVSSASKIEFRGITMGYSFLSGGQMNVLSSEGGKKFTVVGSAGWGEDFGKTDPSRFSTGFTEIYAGEALYPWAVIGNYYTLEKNGDGTMTLTVNDASIAGKMNAGDSMTCRYAGANQSSVRVTDSSNVKFKDCVLYGFSNALAVVASGNVTGMSLERFHNTTQPNPVIDKETYEFYKALEEQYGVSLGIYTDSAGRYRGELPLQGSTDATHIMSTSEGVDVTSSIFEGMTDDGSNQRASSSRLHKIEIEGNVATIYYKGLMAEVYEGTGTGNCKKFSRGDRIRVYSARGEILCETYVTSDAVLVEDMSPITIEGTSITTNVYKVTVSASSIDSEILKIINTQYDLSDNSSDLANRVMVDNLSYNSGGFTFDNVVIRNTRSRGILIKTDGVTVKNCTFQNLAHAGLVICTEPEWGESTAASNVTVSKCIFDNTGAVCDYIRRTDLVPIWIGTGSTSVSANTLPYKNIVIDGCKFQNNKSRYAITVHSVQNLTVTNNEFCPIVDESSLRLPTTLYIRKSMNVNISGNKFTENIDGKSVTNVIKVESSIGITGSDVIDNNGEPLFPDNAN